MSVIVGRGPARRADGLKPVHRRILYAMYEDNLTSTALQEVRHLRGRVGPVSPPRRRVRVRRPARLAQDFSMRYMLVDGHGNFGSVDGVPGGLPIH